MANASVQTNYADSGIPDELESGMTFALIITVLALFGCGTHLNLVLGIAAIVYANRGNRNLESGNPEKAEDCAKTAKTLCWIAIGFIIFQIFVIFLVIAAMVLFYMIPFFIQ